MSSISCLYRFTFLTPYLFRHLAVSFPLTITMCLFHLFCIFFLRNYRSSRSAYTLTPICYIGNVFGLATCLELSRLITLTRVHSLTARARARAWKTKQKKKRVSLYLVILLFCPPFILNYNFADQETAQSRNLSQSPNPDLVLGPRLRGQSPGRSPNPKPSLPQSEFLSMSLRLCSL